LPGRFSRTRHFSPLPQPRSLGAVSSGRRQPARQLGHASRSGRRDGRVAAVMTDVPPMAKWTAAVIAGGGVAGLTQGATAMLRAKSTVLTRGIGNLVIATAELGGALLVALVALAARRTRIGYFLFVARDRPAPASVSRSASHEPPEVLRTPSRVRRKRSVWRELGA
jgi:hypothetical protein